MGAVRAGFSAPVVKHPTLTYSVLTLAISWGFWTALIVTGLRFDQGRLTLGSGLYLLGAFGPTISAVMITGRLLGRAGVRSLLMRVKLWRVGVGWYAFVLLGPAAIQLLSLGLATMFGVVLDLSKLPPLYFLPLAFPLILLLGGPLQEEFGWRGFALPRIQERQSALLASLVLGFVWGLWHLPLYWLPGTPHNQLVSGKISDAFVMAAYVLQIVALSVLFTWVYNNTKGSLLMALLLHASFNTGVLFYLPGLGPEAQNTVFAINTLILWILAFAIVAVTGPSHLSRAGVQ